jgi:hypothetical protein
LPPTILARARFGSEHTCAVKIDGLIVCWGDGGSGQVDVPSP